MEFFVVDAFTDHIFGGNQAGVVILRDEKGFPEDDIMQKIAAELKHSETAFVLPQEGNAFSLRYFTPVDEVPLCGHATISAFTVLREHDKISCGDYIASTIAGELEIRVEESKIWLRMPQGKLVKTLTREESDEIYRAYGLPPQMRTGSLTPCVAKSGLADILVPVEEKEQLDRAEQNRGEVIRLSKLHGGVGVHLYYFTGLNDTIAFCRNFAPLFGIDEESATGTSNAALTYYLYSQGKIATERVNTILQGETMGRPSMIYSSVDGAGNIWIGGSGVISIQGEIKACNFSKEQA